MEEQLKQRLDDLESEFNNGQKMLDEADAKRENLTHSLIRISGAIQVLREEIEKHNKTSNENLASSVNDMENQTKTKVSAV